MMMSVLLIIALAFSCLKAYTVGWWQYPASDQARSRIYAQYAISNKMTGIPRMTFTAPSTKFAVILGAADRLVVSAPAPYIPLREFMVYNAKTGALIQGPTAGQLQMINNNSEIVIADSRVLTGIDLATLKTKWSVRVSANVWPVLASNYASQTRTQYFGAGGATVWATDQFGPLWNLTLPVVDRTDPQVLSTPGVIDSAGRNIFFTVLYDQGFMGSLFYLYCVDTYAQTIKFGTQTIGRNSQLMLIQVYEGPLKSNSEHVIITDNGIVASINVTTGQREWYFQSFGGMLCQVEAYSHHVVPVPPAYDFQLQLIFAVYATTMAPYVQGIFALDAKTGIQKWNYTIPSTAQANAAFFPSAPVIGPSYEGDVVVFGAGSTIYLLEGKTGQLLGTKFLPLYSTGTQTSLTPLFPMPANPMVLWRDASAAPFVARLYTLLSAPTNQTGVYNTVLGAFELLAEQNGLCCLYQSANLSPAAVCDTGNLNSTCPSIPGFGMVQARQVTSCDKCLCN